MHPTTVSGEVRTSSLSEGRKTGASIPTAMAKVGGPPLPPVAPNRPPAEPTPVQQQQPPDAVRQQVQQQPPTAHSSQAAPPNVSPSAQAVAQQFGSAFVSAGKLASQLVKGLAQTNFVPRRDSAEQAKDKAQPQQKEGVEGQVQARRQDPVEGKGEQQQGGGQRQGQETGAQTALGAAFAALRKSRLFRSKKKEQKKGAAGVKGKLLQELQTDYDEEKREEQLVHRWLKGDEEHSAYDQAGRTSQFIGELERQQAPPARIARHLSAELAGATDPEFRRNLAQALQPHLESMAARVPDAPSEERQAVAALLSRAAHRSGPEGQRAFSTVLTRTGEAEAKALAELADDTRTWLEGFERALRRGASAAYRDALAVSAAAELKDVAMRLAAEPVGLSPLLRELLRAAGRLSFEGTQPMAQPIAEAISWVGDERSGAQLLRALVNALRETPEGAGLVVQLLALLWRGDQLPAAEAGAEELAKLLREARQSFAPAAQKLSAYRVEAAKRPAPPSDEERARHDQLVADTEGVASLAIGLLPVAAQVLLQPPPANTQGAMAVGAASLGLVASADVLLSLGPGQALLRRALVAQELGDKSLLDALVPAARILASPGATPHLQAAGLRVAEFGGNGRALSSRLGPQLGRALGALVSARARKGELPGALSLLKVALRNNAALFGVNADGARSISGMFEALVERPSPRAVEQAMPRLEKILRQNAGWDLPFPAKALRPLMEVLAAPRDPAAGRMLPPRPSGPQRLNDHSVLRIEADQRALARARAQEAPPPASTSERPKPPGASGERPRPPGASAAGSTPLGGAGDRPRPTGASGERPRPLGASAGSTPLGASGERPRPTGASGERPRPPGASAAGSTSPGAAGDRARPPGASAAGSTSLGGAGDRPRPTGTSAPRPMSLGGAGDRPKPLGASGERPRVAASSPGSEAGPRPRVPDPKAR